MRDISWIQIKSPMGTCSLKSLLVYIIIIWATLTSILQRTVHKHIGVILSEVYFCTTLKVLIKPTIVNFSTITEIPELGNYRQNIAHKTQQLMYYDGNQVVVVYHSFLY